MNPITSEYFLSWDGHIQHVRKAFDLLLQSNEFCDVTLYAEGQKIGAHKVFLSACSQYFNQLFKDFKDERPVVVLKGLQFNILKHILKFVYNGETNIKADELKLFLEAAAFLKIDGLSGNHLKRKRKHSQSDDLSMENEENNESNMGAEIVEREQQCLPKSLLGEPLKTATVSLKPPKLYKIKNSPSKTSKDSSVNYPDFTKTPEICKYSMDSPTRVGDWLSDYEYNSQSSIVKSQSFPSPDQSLSESINDNSVEESTNVPDNLKPTKIKSEPKSGPSDTDEIPSFDQNDFANSLDEEIEISDDQDNESLEKNLLKKISDDDDDDESLEKSLLKSSLASIDENGLYQCKICSKSYVKKDSLKKHFAVHVNNTTCMICGKVLSRKTHLIRHLKMHGISSN